jgi:hypothetical protein
MLSCQKIADTLSKFEGGQIFKIDNFNPLFEQSGDFDQKYLQLVEDKIKENGWVDPSIDSQNFPDNKYPTQNYQSHENHNEIEEQKSTSLSYREHQTVDLPNEILSLINPERHKNIYFYGMKGPDSFLASVLLAKDPGYWFQHRKKRTEYANELKTTFNIKHHDLFREIEAKKWSVGLHYKDKIFENEFPQGVDSDKSIELQFLIGHDFNVNILVLDLLTKKGHFVTDWNPEHNTVILMKDVKTYLPILSGSGEAPNFTTDEVKGFAKGFEITYPIKMEVSGNNNKSPKSTASSPLTSPKSSASSPVTSPKFTASSPVTSPKSTASSPTTSPKSTASSPTTSPTENTKQLTNIEDLTNETRQSQLLGINKYRVNDLLEFAKKLEIDVTKRNADGKKIKQTKAELYDNIFAKLIPDKA